METTNLNDGLVAVEVAEVGNVYEIPKAPKKQKYFFAKADSFCGVFPREHCDGFANTVYALCFSSEEQRNEYCERTKYMGATILTSTEVRKLKFDIALIDEDFNISSESVPASKFFACRGWKMGSIHGGVSNSECNCVHGCKYCSINYR